MVSSLVNVSGESKFIVCYAPKNKHNLIVTNSYPQIPRLFVGYFHRFSGVHSRMISSRLCTRRRCGQDCAYPVGGVSRTSEPEASALVNSFREQTTGAAPWTIDGTSSQARYGVWRRKPLEGHPWPAAAACGVGSARLGVPRFRGLWCRGDRN